MTRESENNLMAEIAENERWLAQYEAPAPRDGLLDEIKASVRTELSIADDVARMQEIVARSRDSGKDGRTRVVYEHRNAVKRRLRRNL